MRTELITVLLAAALVAAQQIYVPILVDVAHGEATKDLDLWVNRTANPLAISDFAEVHVLVSPGASLDPLLSRLNATRMVRIVRGDFSTVELSRYKVIVLGQPTKPLTEAELAAIKRWLETGGKVLWCAADSDYPAQGSEESQVVCNDIAEYLGARIRVDYVSVEDTTHNIDGAGYRVVGILNPPPQLAFLGFMAHRVLFHGPGAIAVVLPNGTWVPATSPEVQRHYNNVHIIARTTGNGVIVEHRTSGDRKGRDGKAHTAGNRGVFALMALEIMPRESVLILSSETPYGGYQPGVAPAYRRVVLDGPRFFRNLMLWATGSYRELSTIADQTQLNSQLVADVEAMRDDVAAVKRNLATLQNDVAAVKNDISSVSRQTNAVANQLNSLAGQVAALNQKIDQLTQQLNAAVTEANNAKVTAFVGTALALIFAILAAVLALRRGRAGEGTKTP